MRADPVLIGGVGGSGTRVVAEIASQLGIAIGNDLNVSNDYLVVGRHFPAMRDLLKSRTADNAARVDEEILAIIRSFIPEIEADNPDAARGEPWGWKIPANFYFLPYFARLFPGMKYIHTIRNGLDMAFSGNQNQLFNWGDYFGIDPQAGPTEAASLEYWIQANHVALENARRLGEGRFLLVDFDAMCDSPSSAIDDIAAFIGVEPSRDSALAELIRPPATRHRFRNKDCSAFTREQLSRVSALGYAVA